MKKIILLLLSLLLCLSVSGCQSELPGSQTLITAVELEQETQGVRVRLEYRTLTGAEEPEQYEVCEGSGATVPEAIQNAAVQAGKAFYFPSCAVLILVNEQGKAIWDWIAQLNAMQILRPLTMVCLSDTSLLEQPREAEQAVGESLEKLNQRFGWTDSGKMTLKGAVHALTEREFLLPLVSAQEGEAIPAGWVLLGSRGVLRLSAENSLFLPDLPWKNALTVSLPEGGVFQLESKKIRVSRTLEGYELQLKAAGRWILEPPSLETGEEQAVEGLLERFQALQQAAETIGADCWNLRSREQWRSLGLEKPQEKPEISRLSVSLSLRNR